MYYETEYKVDLIFTDPGNFNGSMVKLELVTFGYIPDKILLKNIDLTIDLNYCAALLGLNKCGMSTLVKLMVGALNTINGKSTVDPWAKMSISHSIIFSRLSWKVILLGKWLITIQETDPKHTWQGLGPWFLENSTKTRNYIELSHKKYTLTL